MRMVKLALVTWVVSLLFSCSKSVTAGQAGVAPDSPEGKYLKALDELLGGNYTEAATAFEEISASTLNPVLGQAATLRLGDALFLQSRYAEAAEVYRQYLEQFPNSPDAPRAGYMLGLSFLRRIPEDIWFMPPAESRDMTDVESAYETFVAVIQKSPNTYHAMKARVQLSQVVERRCRHDLYVARYYRKQGKLFAVVQRMEKALAAEEREKLNGWLPESFLCAARKENLLELARTYAKLGKPDGIRRTRAIYEKYAKYFEDAEKGLSEIKRLLEE